MRLPFFTPRPRRNPTIKPLVLLVIDGFGVAPASSGNAISLAKTPTFDRLFATYPHGELIAAGESVGLPANEAGNSEVGHLTIGAGRVVYQSLPRIDHEIKEETFFRNQAFVSALAHARKHNSVLHLLGLVSSGTVHSSMKHLFALLEFARRTGFSRVSLHIFTDGRDAPPQDGIIVVNELTRKLAELNFGVISTVSGRYYGLDRDGRWERTQKTYEALVLGKGAFAPSASAAVQAAYAAGRSDEFIEPTVVSKQPLLISDNDAVIFFNFRIDRPRQLTMAFVFPDFEKLKTVEFGYMPHESMTRKSVTHGPTFQREKWPKNLFFVTMTQYQANLPVSAVAFPPPEVPGSLSSILAERNMNQLHLAESEKERMVTYYFNGLREDKFPHETDIIVPSPRVATYDLKPEMAVFQLVARFRKELFRDTYHFFVLNFANPDMVAHSGNLQATIRAIEAVDKATYDLVEAVERVGGMVAITADHGNAEQMLTFPSGSFFYTSQGGSVNTEHSNNPVPFILVAPHLAGKAIKFSQATLADVAPTILNLMQLPLSSPMTGKNVLG